jgi:hypothetical protein
MKNLVVFAFMIFGLGAAAYAQEINQVRFTGSSAEIKKSIDAGEVTFFFSKNADAEAIKTNAQYYTNFFTVKHDKTSGKCVLMLTQDDMAKLVISRFLMSNGISEVLIEDIVISVQDFIAQYLR